MPIKGVKHFLELIKAKMKNNLLQKHKQRGTDIFSTVLPVVSDASRRCDACFAPALEAHMKTFPLS